MAYRATTWNVDAKPRGCSTEPATSGTTGRSVQAAHPDVSGRRMQRNPRWDLEVSITCAWQAAGRLRGQFGSRGLASPLFALLALDEVGRLPTRPSPS
jgi:hypothetical protein